MAADGLKQRLVGGATLLVVAVIAWFWLLSADSPVDPVARESEIPAAPDIQPFAVQEPAAPANIAPIGSARDSQPALQSDVVPQSMTAAQAAPKSSEPQPARFGDKSVAAKASTARPSSAETGDSKASGSKVSTLKSPALASTKSEPKVAAKAAKDSSGKSSKLVPETFQLDQHGLPIAWVVQVGLFSSQASADKIKATLQEKGFKAYTEVFKGDKASGIKVFVGPKLSRERADAQKKAIDQLLKTNSMVVRFAAN
ncbi:MAG TPA: SPOR domain-containing protein [Spongiibacteraceae bacterium]|nr:SPOR domain-containing protein [Spongiibacteraceae bacterium]